MAHTPDQSRRFAVEFYVVTAGGRKPIKTATMTLAEIEAEVARTNYRTRMIGVAA